ncbi:MAG: HNH endonuclease [Ignavibacteriaceae bacterium]
MKFWVGVTDKNWFEYLASVSPDEINFWKPGGQGFGAVDIGAPFLFKLHSPNNKIVGGGYFIRSEQIPLSLAWDAFGNKNGSENLSDLRNAINKYRNTPETDPTIGCIILNQPFFFTEDHWIDVPSSFAKNIVSGKTYDTNESDGERLWNEVLLRLGDVKIEGMVAEPLAAYGNEYLIKSRLGQGAFRILVTGAYNRKCAISGEKALPVLQAAHIKPFNEQGPNSVNNGLLLRSDLHILFDRGYLTATPENKIEVSRRIKEEFNNGKHYYAFHGKELYALPKIIEDRPSLDFIRWHNENIFRG